MGLRRANRRAAPRDDGATLFSPARPPSGAAFAPRVLAGLDEAGLGPMLGPLSIGVSAFRVPPRTRDLWKALAEVVTSELERDDPVGGGRLVVADSKVVFTRNAIGARRLESTVLAFEAAHRSCATPLTRTREFLEATPERLRATGLARERWYAHLPERLAPECGGDALLDVTARLRDVLARAGVEVALLGVRAVPPSELNASFDVTGSKGATHWRACTPFLTELWTRFGNEGIELVVDRHGGRMRYAPLLRATFPRAVVDVVRELPQSSEYRLDDDEGRAMRVVFAEKADSTSFAVALASCAAKYAREACMEGFNAYFGELQPGLAPTAGYVTDARRWLAEAGPALERSGVETVDLVRSR